LAAGAIHCRTEELDGVHEIPGKVHKHDDKAWVGSQMNVGGKS
jgi:hypothetical protein